ncbi:type IV pilus biogenesis protein PilM [Lederbergia panacisoli]|uniref:type IV pilus biogenesis protein PilM n=1 Tax=Lederbergia panacisoli TaxID=1255251 RepID=UPI00214B03F1|nr:pilus assembly protein PilM [Lederbergia panacisoli]MCR2820547.1 pilus assembly protein PilM [Lederbergia panacisoli]
MSFQLFKRSLKTANIIFTDRAIRFLETVQKSGLEILQMKEHQLTPGIIKDGKIVDPELLRLALDECVDDWKIKRREVRFLIPDPFIIVRQMKVPADIQEDELNGYLFLETGTTIHLPFEDPVIDSVILFKDENKQDILLVAAPRDIVDSYINVLEDVKLKPVIAEISPLSLYRLYKMSDITREDDHILLLHFDEDLLMMSIFHGDIPIFVRPITSDSLLQSAMEMIGEDGSYYIEDALMEIEKVIDFYRYTLNQGRVEINRVLLSGDHEDLSIIKERLNNRLQMTIEQLNVNQYVTVDGRPILASHFPALGLSLKEVESK